jgi:uroporphyrinogen-III synthase
MTLKMIFMVYNILSTKILKDRHRKEFTDRKFSLHEKNFIKISPLIFSFNKTNSPIIFSSKNAVKIVLSKDKMKKNLIKNDFFCVGNETKKLLVKNNLKVISSFPNGYELAEYLIKKKINKDYSFFCGNRRMNTIEKKLKANNYSIKTVEVYKTDLTPKKISKKFDAILFFSPSGVKSFLSINSITSERCFCIGSTTASELMPFTKKIHISENPTIKKLIWELNNFYN